MAVYDLQEQEQIDALKAWWQDNRKFVIGVVTLAIIGVAGFQGWKYWKNDQAAKAAVQFENIQKALQKNQLTTADAAKTTLINEYADTAYASRGVLAIAAYEASNGKLPAAAKDLDWLIQNSKEQPIQDIARLRLSAVKLDQKQFDAALSTLSGITTDALKGVVSFQKADISLAKGDLSAAKTSYRVALEQLDKDDPLRAVVEMKLDALGGN